MGEKSELTIRAEMLADRLYERYLVLLKAWPVPFGMEEISPAEYRRRWQAMTREQRAAEIDRLGLQRVQDLVAGD